MVDLLAGIESKIERAAEHLEEFEAEATAFFAGEPYTVVQEFDAQAGWYIGRLSIKQRPPDKLGIIAGEAIGQCRSALDHLITAAVVLRNPSARKSPNFPIYRNRADWLDAGRDGAAKDIKRMLSPEQFAIVERLQPYNRKPVPTNDGLTLMQSFTNLDKHHVTHPTFAMTQALWRTGMPRTLPDPNIETIRFPFGPGLHDLDDGAEVYRVRFRDDSNVYVVFQIHPEIVMTTALGARVNDTSVAFAIWFTCKVVDEFRGVTPAFQPAPTRTLAAVELWDEAFGATGTPGRI